MKKLSRLVSLPILVLSLSACVHDPAPLPPPTLQFAEPPSDIAVREAVLPELAEPQGLPVLEGLPNAQDIELRDIQGEYVNCELVDGRDYCTTYGYSVNSVHTPRQAAPYQVQIVTTEKYAGSTKLKRAAKDNALYYSFF